MPCNHIAAHYNDMRDKSQIITMIILLLDCHMNLQVALMSFKITKVSKMESKEWILVGFSYWCTEI